MGCLVGRDREGGEGGRVAHYYRVLLYGVQDSLEAVQMRAVRAEREKLGE
jgi:hypothetical protein